MEILEKLQYNLAKRRMGVKACLENFQKIIFGEGICPEGRIRIIIKMISPNGSFMTKFWNGYNILCTDTELTKVAMVAKSRDILDLHKE